MSEQLVQDVQARGNFGYSVARIRPAAKPRAARDRGVHRDPALLLVADGVDARAGEAARRPVDGRQAGCQTTYHDPTVGDRGAHLALGAAAAARC